MNLRVLSALRAKNREWRVSYSGFLVTFGVLDFTDSTPTKKSNVCMFFLHLMGKFVNFVGKLRIVEEGHCRGERRDEPQKDAARALPIVISASRRITLESPPYSQNTRLKAYREAYGASSTVRLYPASVRAETKTSLPDKYASITFL